MAVDQDYFIPVRDPAAPNPIDTLAGAQNLSEIADIEYLQKKLVTALRIPKAFLGFEDVVGDGKSLALMDIRFARTINRIQKSMVQELNKIAIIHLFLLGFDEEISNFTLGLTNPSTQADLLKIDIWKEKMLLYKDMVSDPGTGIAATSSTWAKKHLFQWSDDEIRVDLLQQRMEKAVGEELKQTPTVIVKTGIFDNIDRLYGTNKAPAGTPPPSGDEAGAPPELGGAFAGGDLGGEVPPTGELGGIEPPSPPPGEITPESAKNRDMNILLESDMYSKKWLDLGMGQQSLGKIGEELDKLLNS
jgi:hypothetical protein